jgi:hypothetical protein
VGISFYVLLTCGQQFVEVHGIYQFSNFARIRFSVVSVIFCPMCFQTMLYL